MATVSLMLIPELPTTHGICIAGANSWNNKDFCNQSEGILKCHVNIWLCQEPTIHSDKPDSLMPHINHTWWMLPQSLQINPVALTMSSPSHDTACLFKVNGYSKFELHCSSALPVSKGVRNETSWPLPKEKFTYLSSDITCFLLAQVVDLASPT